MLEQVDITECEIERRKELLDFTDADARLLRNCKGFIEVDIDAIIAEFYRIQMSFREIASLVGDAETLARLHTAQRGYVLDLFQADTGIDYVKNRLRIGMVHKRIGVPPKLFLAAVRTLKDLIRSTLKRRISDPAVLAETCWALDKLLYFDVTLVFDTYILSLVSEVETAKSRIEHYAANLELLVTERTRQLEEKVSQLQTALLAVKQLEGVIPICGVCKKIRNDKQSWQQLEQYISEHSQALFSHGLCPDCYEKEMRALRAVKAVGAEEPG